MKEYNVESPAEEKALPFLIYIAKLMNGKLKTQLSITEHVNEIHDWVYDKFDGDTERAQEWIDQKWGYGGYKSDEPPSIDYNYSYEKYRLDFAILPHQINIEIDGRNFHDQVDDARRDAYLERLGWTIIRIRATDVFSGFFKILLMKELKLDPQKKLSDLL